MQELKQAAVLEAAQTVTIEAAQTQPIFATVKPKEENKAADPANSICTFLRDHIARKKLPRLILKFWTWLKKKMNLQLNRQQTKRSFPMQHWI